jgi:hypothetical protein
LPFNTVAAVGRQSTVGEALTVGPDWLVLVAVLAIPAMISHHQGNWRLSQSLGYAASMVVTLAAAISLCC